MQEILELIVSAFEREDTKEGESGILEAARCKETKDALESIGYLLADLSGDNVLELIIGSCRKSEFRVCEGNEIYAVYTCVDNKPKLCLEGSSRNIYFPMKDGGFLSEGSNGAMYTIYGTYQLKPDGTALDCKDYYFSYEKDETFKELGYYHNTTGEWDKAVSEELDITSEQFSQIEADFEKETVWLDLEPFSMYKSAEGYKEPKLSESEIVSESETPKSDDITRVNVAFAKDILANYDDYEEFTVDESDYQTQVVFTTDHDLKDVKFLELSLEDVDEEGNVKFSQKELYTMKNFAVQESGMDGSLLLEEF